MTNLNIRPLLLAFASATLVITTVSGCAVARDQSTVGAYIDDATLTTRVKGKLAENKDVSAAAISVETLNGTVQLSGFAKTTMERGMAEKLARETSGVKSVRNDIIVRN